MSPIKIGDLVLYNYWNETFLGYVTKEDRNIHGEVLWHVRMFKEERLFVLSERQRGKTWDLA